MSRTSKVLVAVAVLPILACVIWFAGSENPYTPAGFVGYLTQGAIFGQARFVGMQKGPTSAGRGWKLDVLNVSVTPYTYPELYQGANAVQAHDKLMVDVEIHLVWKIDETKVRDFVNSYSYLLGGDKNPDKVVKDAYDNFLKGPLGTITREEVHKYDGLEAADHLDEIGQAISAKVEKLTAPTPFRVTSVVVGKIQPPQEVTNSIAKKVATTQERDRQKTENEIAVLGKQKRITEAEGIAKAMEIIQSRLSPLYIQHEAIEAQKAMVNSPNHTTVYIPVGHNGVPLVGNLDPAEHAKKKD